MPAFLPEDAFVDARKENRIEVDVDEVVEILSIGAGVGVAGLVGLGERIQERLKRALEELHERLLDGVALGTAQHGMFEDVRHAG